MTPEQKQWIEDASFEQLLRHWRNAPSGDPIFEGEAGVYYRKTMASKRAEGGPGAAVAASKRVGWD